MKSKHGYYDVFVRTCAKNPSNIAMRVYDDGKYKKYTYSELYGVCEYIAQNIQQIKCTKNIIGLVTDRNAIIPSLIAASHRCSTCFIFIDPSQDVEAIIKHTKLNIIMHVKDLKWNTSKLFTQEPDKIIKVFDLEINIYNLKPEDSEVSCNYSPKHSFIARTSGSTGEPKYIQTPLKCIEPNVDDLTKLFEITPKDVIYFSTPLTFDPSMVEILLSCINGASLFIAPEKADILFPEKNENSVTFWQTTPSKFFQYSAADITNRILSAKSTLKVLALGGEPLNGIRRIKELKAVNNKTKIFTLYGVTEMSCWACVAELNLNKISDDKEIPLGNCLSETKLVVQRSNENSNTGNIVLFSKTRKCTILNKSKGRHKDNSAEYIDTGDIGEIKNGTIYYRGRKDDIIKRFGHKVSLQNIETTIMLCPKVASCSCVWLPKPMLLVVYFKSESFKTKDLKNFLKCKLDDKHWPDKIIRVDSLPVNSHGKTSKRMLSQMANGSMLLPQKLNTTKALIMNELRLLLNRSFTYDEIKDKDFFSIGGTSFYAISMCNKISLRYPELGKHILPYLVNQKFKLGEILELVSKGIKKERTRKRLRLCLTKKASSTSTIQTPIYTKTILYKIAWSYDTGKCVDATPTLFEDELKVYVTVGSHSGKIVVLDAISGEIQGTVTVKSRVEASVVCSANELLRPCGIVGTYDGTVVCFTLHTCEIVWRINIGSMIKSKGVVCNGGFYVASYDGNIRNINISGHTYIAPHIQNFPPPTEHNCTTPLSPAANRRYTHWASRHSDKPNETRRLCYFTSKSSVDDSFDQWLEEIERDSVTKWQHNYYVATLTGEIKEKIPIVDMSISADLVLAKEEFILVGTLSGLCACVNTVSKTIAWRILLGSPIFASPVVYNSERYVVFAEVSGAIHCRTVEKGIKIWEYQGAKGNIFSSMYFKKLDKLSWEMIFGCHDKNVYSVIISHFQTSLRWKSQLTSPVYSTPCGFQGKYIVAASNNGVLCMINSDDGSIVSKYHLRSEIFSSPRVYNEFIYIGCRDDYLYSITCNM